MTAAPFRALAAPTHRIPETARWRWIATDYYTGADRVELRHVGQPAFNLPLSDNGQVQLTFQLPPEGTAGVFAATQPNRSGLRGELDGEPVWDGVIRTRRNASSSDGALLFGQYELVAYEWGQWLDGQLNEPDPHDPATGTLDFPQTDVLAIPRRLITRAQAADRGGPGIVMDETALSGLLVDRTFYWYEATPYLNRITDLIADDGTVPEWYIEAVKVGGRKVRRLVQGVELSRTTEVSGLSFEYVNSALEQPWRPPPSVIDLSDVSPAPRPAQALTHAGGNVISQPETPEDGSTGCTAVLAIGAGQDESTEWAVSYAHDLLAAGWPLRWYTDTTQKDVADPVVLQAHADATLEAQKGLITSIQLTTWGDDPLWTNCRRGDWAKISIDLPELAPRPKCYVARVLDRQVTLAADGGREQVVWTFSQTAAA